MGIIPAEIMHGRARRYNFVNFSPGEYAQPFAPFRRSESVSSGILEHAHAL